MNLLYQHELQYISNNSKKYEKEHVYDTVTFSRTTKVMVNAHAIKVVYEIVYETEFMIEPRNNKGFPTWIYET